MKPTPNRWGLILCLIWLMAGCTGRGDTPASDPTAFRVTLHADNQSYNLTTQASNVRELLEESGLTTEPTDLIDPPPFTPLQDNLEVTVIRVTESIEIIQQAIPFERKIIRNENMEANAPPLIVQGGQAGLLEITVRIVYHDGLEVERRPTSTTVISEAQDEIVMVGVGAAAGNLNFGGQIAYIGNGQALILRGSTAFPETLATGEGLDGRVFSLSPTGSHLLYSRVVSDTGRFNNSLWVIATTRNAQPRPLDVYNVLWADWNPARIDLLQIAYTTAIPVDTPPGWEANNDLWVGDILQNEAAPFEGEQIVEAYPATYSWWGGNFAWSPAGQHIAYAYADEVGLIDLESPTPNEERLVLHRFVDFDTNAEWVWLPSLTWAANGLYLAFTVHGGQSQDSSDFDLWVADSSGRITARFSQQTGMWGHPHWAVTADGPLAFLQATNPLESLRSNYTLWLMDSDGSNRRQIYPAVGENSRFPLDQQFMAWGPTGRDIAFIFNNALYLFNLDSQQAFRVTQDDTQVRRPTWAPYGLAIPENLPPTSLTPDNDLPNNPNPLPIEP